MNAYTLTQKGNGQQGDKKGRDKKDSDHSRQGQAAKRHEIQNHREDKTHAPPVEAPEHARWKSQHATDTTGENGKDDHRQDAADQRDLGERHIGTHQLDQRIIQRDHAHRHGKHAKRDERTLHPTGHRLSHHMLCLNLTSRLSGKQATGKQIVHSL